MKSRKDEEKDGISFFPVHSSICIGIESSLEPGWVLGMDHLQSNSLYLPIKKPRSTTSDKEASAHQHSGLLPSCPCAFLPCQAGTVPRSHFRPTFGERVMKIGFICLTPDPREIVHSSEPPDIKALYVRNLLYFGLSPWCFITHEET